MLRGVYVVWPDDDGAYDHRPGQPLRLSEAYRRSQLPLVAPAHPDAIRSDPARGYDDMGSYRAPRVSLIAFVDLGALLASAPLRELLRRLALGPAGAKIAWAMIARRRACCHFTIAGGLHERGAPDEVIAELRARLAGAPRFSVALGGLSVPAANTGRGYLCVHPAREPGGDALSRLRATLGAAPSPRAYVGLLQLADHLTAEEADAWFAAAAAYREARYVELAVTELAVVATHDDLLLQHRTLAAIPLT